MDRSVSFSINHMTAAFADLDTFIQMAQKIDTHGVEFRNDLSGPLFDDESPSQVRQTLQSSGLTCHALAEIKSFDTLKDDEISQSMELLDIAEQLGADAVSFIPNNDGLKFDGAQFRKVLQAFAGPLKSRGLVGYIEPLGFETCGLRFKVDVVDALAELGLTDQFMLIHDTFHHHVAGEKEMFPQHTGHVHISGVSDQSVSTGNMTDAHRGLVEPIDRLGNISQIQSLLDGGYRGSFSFEVFDPSVQTDPHLSDRLERSMTYISSALLQEAA